MFKCSQCGKGISEHRAESADTLCYACGEAPEKILTIEGDGWSHHNIDADKVREELTSFLVNEFTAEKIEVTDANGNNVPIEITVTVSSLRYDLSGDMGMLTARDIVRGVGDIL